MKPRLFAFSAALLLGPSAASAESAVAPPQCRVRLIPAFNAKIPANAPALVIDHASGLPPRFGAFTLSPTANQSSELSLVSDSRSEGVTLAVPSTALPSGVANTSVTFECPGAASGFEKGTAGAELEVIAASPLPTISGTAFVTPSSISPGSSTIHFEPSAELVPFLPVAKLELTVDSLTVGVWPYGSLDRDNSIALVMDRNWGPRDLCGSNTDKVTISATIQAHVAGASSDPPPITLDVPIDCAPLPPSSATEVDAEPGPSSNGGCSVGESRTGNPYVSAAFAALVGFIALAASRSRRRARNFSRVPVSRHLRSVRVHARQKAGGPGPSPLR